MNSSTSKTVFLLLLLLLGGCARISYPTDEPTNTLPAPVTEPRYPVVNETASTPAVNEIPQAAVADWETLYTEDNPVTDPQELIRILQDLKGRFLNQFDKSGWYELKWLDLQTNWIHVSNSGSNKFDGIITYYEHEKYPEGFLNPHSFYSLDRHFGTIRSNSTLDDFYFVSLETPPPETVWENLDYFLSCDFCVASEHLDYLVRWIRDPEKHTTPESRKDTIFTGWVGIYNNQLVFVFNANVTFHTNMPITEEGERVLIDDTSYYISLDNGGTIDEITDSFYLSGGKGLNDLLPYNLQQIAYFEELPERVQTLYDECYKKLIEFEGQN